MGIEQFFSSIQDNSITNLNSRFRKTLERRLSCTHFYIDFNSIVYITNAKVLADLNYLLYRIIIDDRNNRFKKITNLYGIDEKITLSEFKNRYDQDGLTAVILNKIEEYLINAVTNYVDPNELELLYIAIDGVPSKAKIIVQRDRRYIGGLMSETQKRIFSDNKESLDKVRLEFENAKLHWSRNLITPGTEFMDRLNRMLASDSFKKKIKDACPKFKTYILSGSDIPGEGEKKIVDHVRTINPSRLVIYSPDSDVILLALLLHLDNVIMLRHNQQKDLYDVIDIDRLGDNIFRYVSNKVEFKPDKKQIIDDIVMLLTLFGDDFLPKMESISARNDFGKIIDDYISVLCKDQYLVVEKGGKKVINQPFFIDIIKQLQIDEGGNLQKMYMQTHYHNYNYLKKTLGADNENFIKVMNEFLNKLDVFNNFIRKNRVTEWKKDEDFLKRLQKFTRLPQHTKRVRLQTSVPKNNFMESYVEYYKKNKKFPEVGVSFRRKKRSIMNSFYREKLEKSLDIIDPKLKITKYDEELFKFNNMLDEYIKKVNATALDLGKVRIENNSWVTEKIKKSVIDYYDEFFGVTDLDGEKMDMIVEQYVEGLMWVFEFYFNNFDIEHNKNYAYTWFYQNTHAPLLKQVFKFLDKKSDDKMYLNKIANKVINQKVKMSEYFTPVEHLAYVSPIPIIYTLIPARYHRVIKQSSIHHDVQKMSLEKDINCRGAFFLTKCHVRIRRPSAGEDSEFITKMRSIKDGGKRDEYLFYKKRYLSSRDPEDKWMYKFFKHHPH